MGSQNKERSATFPAHDCVTRISQVREAIVESGCDALMVGKSANLRYLTGFTGSSGCALVSADSLWFVTDGRYDEQCRLELDAAGIEAQVQIAGPEGLEPELGRFVGELGIKSLALEAGDVSWKLQLDVTGWLSGVEVVPTNDLVETLRMSKADSEVARMRAAAALGDAAFEFILDRIEPGQTELELARELERFMVDAGADAISFDAIVAAGARAAMPHARPSDNLLGAGEAVLLDFGCVVEGYCSDMTRTVFLGAPVKVLEEVYSVVLDAQLGGVDAVAPGVACKDVDSACRDRITSAGFGNEFAHSTGHGVGLEIHEEPRLSQMSAAILAAGHAITVEPGIYLTDIGGVRIEDMVLVTGDGPAVLTSSPKELIVL